jgi:hypothetical protein
MTAKAGVIIAVALAGCGIGSDGSNPPSPDGPKSHILCATAVHTQGTYTQGQARPIDPQTNMPMTGCWPDGTWTFTATAMPDSTQAAPQCSGGQAPTFAPSYTFSDTRMANDTGELTVDSFTYTGMAHWTLHISESGNGYCDADFEIYSDDGHQVWNLHPSLDSTTNMLNGGGDFTLYDNDQWNGIGP